VLSLWYECFARLNCMRCLIQLIGKYPMQPYDGSHDIHHVVSYKAVSSDEMFNKTTTFLIS
jgi:hypothetical protein